MADRIDVPMVHTIHGSFSRRTVRFHRRHGHTAQLVAISRTQAESVPAEVGIADLVPNPMAVEHSGRTETMITPTDGSKSSTR